MRSDGRFPILAPTLTLVRREGEQLHTSTVADVRFVPLLGEFGFR